MKKKILIAVLIISLLTSVSVLATSASNGDTFIPKDEQELCFKAGDKYGISPYLLMAIIERESAGKQYAKNGTCVGLMQLNSSIHNRRMQSLGYSNIWDKEANIMTGADLLAELFAEYEDVGYVLDRYNGNSKAKYYYDNGILSSYSKKILEREAEICKAQEN